MQNIRKSFLLAVTPLTVLVTFSLATTFVHADTTDKADSQSVNTQQILKDYQNKGTITYQDDDITVRSFEDDATISNAISQDPNTVTATDSSQESDRDSIESTSVGDGGVARLNAADNGHALFWSVKPDTAWPYSFNGAVNIAYYSGRTRPAEARGFGVLGSTVSGVVTMNKNHGGYAKLTGTAISADGSTYKVLPDVGTSF